MELLLRIIIFSMDGFGGWKYFAKLRISSISARVIILLILLLEHYKFNNGLVLWLAWMLIIRAWPDELFLMKRLLDVMSFDCTNLILVWIGHKPLWICIAFSSWHKSISCVFDIAYYKSDPVWWLVLSSKSIKYNVTQRYSQLVTLYYL